MSGYRCIKKLNYQQIRINHIQLISSAYLILREKDKFILFLFLRTCIPDKTSRKNINIKCTFSLKMDNKHNQAIVMLNDDNHPSETRINDNRPSLRKVIFRLYSIKSCIGFRFFSPAQDLWILSVTIYFSH